jgi:hypothetical protein
LWGEPPAFGGVGGTLPPRLSPGGGNGKGGDQTSLLPQAFACALYLDAALLAPLASPYSHSEAGIPHFWETNHVKVAILPKSDGSGIEETGATRNEGSGIHWCPVRFKRAM